MTQHASKGTSRRFGTGIAATVIAALALTGCSASEPEQNSAPAEEGVPEISQITVGVLPYAELSGFYYALNEGFFEDEGLEIEVLVGAGGAVQIPGLVSESVDITYTSFVTALQAVDAGLDLRILRGNDTPGEQGLYVSGKSAITEAKDLEGAKIAVTPLGGFMDMTSRAVLGYHGVNTDSLNFVELPPQDMFASVEAGNVDAAWLVEPFITLALQEGARKVVSAFEGPTKNVPVAGWAVTPKFFEQNPNTAAAFVRAMDKGIKAVANDQSLVVETVPTYTAIKPELAKLLTPSGWAVDSNLSGIKDVSDIMLKYGLIDNPVDVDTLVIDRSQLPGM